ncbi:MAG: hypothetical protein CM15mP73_5430 [Hyphomicrobiales bacterium]|nr:MAG: hypothetical protein CM15mP73_5430 [Hyphomicrobiales bacterium]
MVVKKAAHELAIIIDDASRKKLLKIEGTPRIANRLLRRVHDYSVYNKLDGINVDLTRLSLQELEVDDIGLNSLDYRYLECIIENYDGGPAGS